jgi:hypothetical protein
LTFSQFERNLCYKNGKLYLLLSDLVEEKGANATRRLVEITVNLEAQDF